MSPQERPASEYENVIDWLAVPAVSFAPIKQHTELASLVIENTEGENLGETD